MAFNPLFESALSTSRFDTYRQLGVDDDHAWALYQWNKELSSAAMWLACDLEVALRNTIHNQLELHFARSDWWASPDLRLDDETRGMLAKAVTKHRKALDRGTATPGRVIADLMFGSWVNLVGAGGRTSLGEKLDYETNLWRPAIRLGFATGQTNARGRQRRPTRQDVFDRAANFKKLRNRMAHHEPIHQGIVSHGGGSRISLVDVWNGGLELLGWMNGDLAHLHMTEQLVPTIYAARP